MQSIHATVKELIVALLIFCLFLPAGIAQNEVDALRFSNTQVPGTARSLGMGGAFGALGADGSAYWINPGGLGAYRRSSVEMTLNVNDFHALAAYEGNEAADGRTNLTIQSFSLNSTRAIDNSRWKSYTLGFGYGKSNNFHQQIRIDGEAANTTLLDVFAAQANGTSSAELMDKYPFGAGLAWESFVIDPLNEDDLTYVPAASGGAVRQSQSIEREGSMSETSFGFGANYADWLYIGGTLSFHGINFSEVSRYQEDFRETDDLKSYQYRQDLRASGAGIGMKLGAIACPTAWLRLGAAWHSGVRYGISDTYSAEISSQFLDGGSEGFGSPVNVFEYVVQAPRRIHGSVAFVLGDGGVVSADYERTNYGAIRMESTESDYSFNAENQAIGMLYRTAHRVRAGAELRLAEAWRARFGAQYMQSPFVLGANSNSAQIGLSAGGGFRRDALFADLAAMFSRRREDYYMYNPQLVNPASIAMSQLAVMLSLGLRF